MLSVAKLADHLGLTSLCKFAAEAIVQRPWEHGLSDLMAVHLLTPYEDNEQQWCELLHHPKRGAYTELQLLDFLKEYHICEQTIAGFLQMDQMHSSEIKALLLILSSPDPQWTCPWHQGPLTVHRTSSGSKKGRGRFIDGSLCPTPGRLLQKAVQQSLLPTVTQPSTAIEQYTQLVPRVTLPAAGQKNTLHLDLPDAQKMKLFIQWSNVSEKGRHRFSCSTCKGVGTTFTITHGTIVPEIGHSCSCNLTYSAGLLCAGVPSCGLYVMPPTDARAASCIQSFALFSVHERAPYVRFCTKYNPIMFKVGEGLGHGEFFDNVRTAYPEGYTGPFTVGVWWQSRLPLATSSGA